MRIRKKKSNHTVFIFNGADESRNNMKRALYMRICVDINLNRSRHISTKTIWNLKHVQRPLTSHSSDKRC